MPRSQAHYVVLLLWVQAIVGQTNPDWCTLQEPSRKPGEYRIHGMTPFPAATFQAFFGQTFNAYLNSTVGSKCDPPISFVSASETWDSIFTSAELGKFDFLFTFPNMAGCIEAEFNAVPLLTLRNLRRGKELNRYGGVIFTNSSREDIKTIADLRGKVVTATNILLCQHQWRVFNEEGVNMFGDISMMRFADNEETMIDEILSGKTDAAFTRTDSIETWEDEVPSPNKKGRGVKGLFRVISEKKGLTVDNGKLNFPFKASSQLYPESALMAMPSVDQRIQKEVMDALLKLTRSSNESKVGFNAGWQPALSYGEARDLYTSLGLMKYNEEKKVFQCIRATLSNYYGGIVCPQGQFKKSEAEVRAGCAAVNQTCPDKFTCICQPCVKGAEVELSKTQTPFVATGCKKMNVCGALEMKQMQELVLHVRDNKLRGGNCTVRIRDPEERIILSVTTDAPSHYMLKLQSSRAGTHVMQFFIGNEEAPDSPFIIEVKPRDCDNGEVATMEGYCACPGDMVKVGGTCTGLKLLLPVIIVPVVVFALVVTYLYGLYKHRAADSVWKIRFKDLKFPSPPEVLGIGTFGVVIKAEYFGTSVAVKRVIPQEESDANARGMASTRYNNSTVRRGSWMHQGSGAWASQGSGTWKNQGSGAAKSGKSIFDLAKEVQPAKEDINNSSTQTHAYAPNPSKASLSPFGAREPQMSVTFNNVTALASGGMSGSLKPPGMVQNIKNCLGFSEAAKVQKALQQDFILEMRMLSRLRHPCIISVMGAVMEKGQEPMLVMEMMEHGSLFDLLHNETLVLEADITLGILRDIARGIRFLHNNRPTFIHGDLKAANVLIDIRFGAKVADFGLSQKKKLGATGTPYWMAPELLAGESNSTASDIYSLGITIWEIMSRRVLYEGDVAEKALEGVLKGRRPNIPAHTSEDMSLIIQACWHGVAALRPSAEEVDEQIKAIDAKSVEIDSQVKSKQYSKLQVDAMTRTTDLLYSIFPRHIADTLKAGGKVDPQSHSNVSIFFSDIVGFTDLAAKMDPLRISKMLDRLYSVFDALVAQHDVFKVETIGDAYMATTNVVKDQPDHAERLIRFGIAALKAASEMRVDENDPSLGTITIRVGINSGPVVSNVVGTANPRYCLFGDAVNTASRMESNSKPGMIHISESCHDLVVAKSSLMKEFRMISRGSIQVKGKGQMKTWWVIPQGDVLGGRIPRNDSQDELGSQVAIPAVILPDPDASNARTNEIDLQMFNGGASHDGGIGMA